MYFTYFNESLRVAGLQRTPVRQETSFCDETAVHVCRCIGIPILHNIDRLGRDSNLQSIDHSERTQALIDHGYEDIDEF